VTPCGTLGAAGYMRHRRVGEPVCDECRVAYRSYHLAYQQEWRTGREWDRVSRRYRRRLSVADRVMDVVEAYGPISLVELPAFLTDVAEATLVRTVYRMVDRGDITRNPVTLCYSVGSEEG